MFRGEVADSVEPLLHSGLPALAVHGSLGDSMESLLLSCIDCVCHVLDPCLL